MARSAQPDRDPDDFVNREEQLQILGGALSEAARAGGERLCLSPAATEPASERSLRHSSKSATQKTKTCLRSLSNVLPSFAHGTTFSIPLSLRRYHVGATG